MLVDFLKRNITDRGDDYRNESDSCRQFPRGPGRDHQQRKFNSDDRILIYLNIKYFRAQNMTE